MNIYEAQEILDCSDHNLIDEQIVWRRNIEMNGKKKTYKTVNRSIAYFVKKI